jgi:glycosyltransferase involved in cell wall biosynthesis
LLDALRAQTCPPDEIIVADAGSKDGTAELACERGARVAQRDVFLFLNAYDRFSYFFRQSGLETHF